jgi:16S rRNA (adenine1518-N6/adenine1519-N6)-dimethyltransferase
MFELIKAAFGQRRKTLVNALHNQQALQLSREQILNALRQMDLDQNIRGEKLTLEQFAILSGFLWSGSSLGSRQ